ncbi:MAG: M1 family metallopeptidase [Bacteroidota bacterium]
MKKAHLSFLLLLLLSISLNASEKKYFQQEVNHKINVSLDDVRHMLTAHIETEYINNSEDTLEFIYMHLWPNAYSSNKSAFAEQQLKMGKTDFHFSNEDERGFIDSLDFKINNNRVNWQYHNDNPDIALLFPLNPIMPNDTVYISTPFRLKFPESSFSRLGHNNQAYHVTQWYPKPAVYDKNGWHPIPYLSIGEFYSEFGNFDVNITLPQNYIVASSGELKTESEKEFIDSLAYHWHMIKFSQSLPDRKEFPVSSKENKSINYQLKNAHDFAWVADKRFYILKDSVKLENADSYIVTNVFFTKHDHLWENALLYLQRTISFMSENIGKYPYRTYSAVQVQNSGGANMEYPALTVIGGKLTDFQLERVLAHEIIHNWFYGILAFNEREHPWLDEGFTSYFDNRYIEKYHPNRKLAGEIAGTWFAHNLNINHYPYAKENELNVNTLARLNIDKPPALSSEELDMMNYFSMAYSKAATSIKHLEKYLGTENFDRIIKIFYENWKFKHPYPDDLKNTFEKESNKNLSWFFDDLIGSTKKLNYKAKSLKNTGNQYIVSIKNKGRIAAPIPVSAMKENKIMHTIWLEGFDDTAEAIFPEGDYTHFTIDPNYYTLHYKRRNNTIYNRKFLPRIQPPEIQYFASIENPLKTQIFASPVLGWNNINGFMPGFAFYNQVIPYNSTELFFMPMFGLENDKPAGQAWAYKTFFNRKKDYFHSIRAGVEIKSYGINSFYFDDINHYVRVQPSVELHFNKSASSTALKNSMKFRTLYIKKDRPYISPPDDLLSVEKYHEFWIYELSYNHSKNYTLNSYSISSTIQLDNNMLKAWMEAQYSFIYNAKKKSIHFRLFAGNFFISPEHHTLTDYRFRLGGHTGRHDYLYDNVYLDRAGRSKTFLGNQLYLNDGGFRFNTAVGQTNDWLVALNTTIELPYIPLNLFADIGTYENAANAYPGSKMTPYVIGFEVEVVKDVISVYLPILVSTDIQKAAGPLYENYWQKITFTIRYDKLNPFNVLRNFTDYIN